MRPQYELVDSSASDENSSEGKEDKKEKKKKKRKRRNRSSEVAAPLDYGPSSRKPDGKSWANTTNKEYYFDSRGDRDNLAFGCIYRYVNFINPNLGHFLFDYVLCF